MQLSSHPAPSVADRSSDPSRIRKCAAKLENPNAKYLVGWSRGKETLKSGRYDTLKGSYYVNCAAAFSQPSTPSEREYPDFPEYTAPNVWPEEAVLPGFKQCFEELCSLVIDTAILVARACDRYGVRNIEGYEAGYLERIVATSTTTKARLLHYFPNPLSSHALPNESHTSDDPEEDDDDNDNDNWCATHTDHGCLTGLTSAMYIDETTIPIPPPTTNPPLLPPPLSELPAPPDPAAGLYIHTRTGQVVQVRIPRDSLAFQTGEALQVMTRGKFQAVPHFVRGGGRGRGRVARNTLAVFTQPDLGEVVDRERGLDFAGFARGVVERGV